MNPLLTSGLIKRALKKATDSSIYGRGVDYFHSGKVRAWSVKEEVGDRVVVISGKVKGSRIYEATIEFDSEDGACFDAICSCPYEHYCKHAVALGLAFAESLESGKAVNECSNPSTAKPVHKNKPGSPLDITGIREALQNMGFAADKMPEDVIEQLLKYRDEKQSTVNPATTQFQIAANANLEPKKKLTKPFRAEDYYISLTRYQGYAPVVYKKAEPYQQTSINKILERDDITPAQRELLLYIKTGTPGNHPTRLYDPSKLFPLLVAAGFPIYSDYYRYGQKKIIINLHPEPLRVQIVHEPLPMYAEKDKIRHDFFLRMPDGYWQNRDSWENEPFFIMGSNVIYDLEHTLELHRLTPLLTGIIKRIEPAYDYEDTGRKLKRHETLLTGEEIAQFDQLVKDASKFLALITPPPNFELKTLKDEPTPALVVDFDNDAQTLHIAPIIDYGFYKQDISESVYESRRMGGTVLSRREPYEHPGTHIVTVIDNIIYCAKADGKKEITWHKILASKIEEFGFTKTLKCQRRGLKLNEYLKEVWPTLSGFMQDKEYPIIFGKDKLPLEQAAFRADFSAKADTERDWLYFDVACYCGEERITTEKLLAYIKSGQPFWRRDDGTLVRISNEEELKRLVRLLESFQAREDGGFEGRLHHTSELEYVMTSSPHYNAVRAESLRKFLNRMQTGRPVKPVRLPVKLTRILRPYQKSGIEWLYFLRSYRFAGILADDMGLGKTLQALAVIWLEKVAQKPSLVICPKSLVYNWKMEAEKFFPKLRLLAYEGPTEERRAMRRKMKQYDLIVMNYSTLRRDEENLAKLKIRFNYIVLDEAQFIKNHTTKNAQTAKKINADYRLALTGTPLENNVSEIWSIYDFLMPGFLGSYEHFTKNFHKPIMDEGDHQALAHLKRKVESFMLRRTKAEVLTELPPKIEQVSQCHLSEAQNILYQQILAKVRGEVFTAVDQRGFKSSQIHILAGLMKLRQACNHPALLTKDKDWRTWESAKLDMCLELVEEVALSRRKVLIFSQFTKMLDIVSEALTDRNIKHVYLSGKTRDRQSMVNQFNTDPEITVFLISMKAGGTGLNLASADTVIVFDPWWNPSVENQAVDRAHRIGQTKTVNVYRLLTSGTIEEKIQALKQKKQNLFNAMVGESGNLFNKLTWDDVRELFAD